jgi:hypothetical protein
MCGLVGTVTVIVVQLRRLASGLCPAGQHWPPATWLFRQHWPFTGV